MIVDNIKKILSQNEAFAKKKFGQNFLVNKEVLEEIIKVSNVDKETSVIEIGPGLGSLTEFLAINAKQVLCYEVDDDMISILERTISHFDNVKVLKKDVLKANIDLDIAEYLNDARRVVVVANLPYYITTPIILKFLEESKIEEFTLMVQKEVGQRLSGKPSTKDYNALSVLINYLGEASIKYKVPKNSFYPEPKVESVILGLKRVKNDYKLINELYFFNFIKLMFAQRRKTLINNLTKNALVNKEELLLILNKINLSESVRSEELDLDTIIKLYKAIYEN